MTDIVLVIIAVQLGAILWRGSTWRQNGTVETWRRRWFDRRYTTDRTPILKSKARR